MKAILTCVLLLGSSVVLAQYNKVSVEQKPQSMEVLQVDQKDSSTVVFLKLTCDEYDGCNINKNTFARTRKSYKQYRLLNSINIPISTEAEIRYMVLEYPNQVHCFALEFEKIPDGVSFDIIEDEQSPNAFNFFGIAPDTTQKGEFVNIDKMLEFFPITKTYGTYWKEDHPVSYVMTGDIILSFSYAGCKHHGDYYNFVFVDMQNFSGKTVLLSDSQISIEGLVFQKNKEYKVIPFEVLHNETVDKLATRVMEDGRIKHLQELQRQVAETIRKLNNEENQHDCWIHDADLDVYAVPDKTEYTGYFCFKANKSEASQVDGVTINWKIDGKLFSITF